MVLALTVGCSGDAADGSPGAITADAEPGDVSGGDAAGDDAETEDVSTDADAATPQDTGQGDDALLDTDVGDGGFRDADVVDDVLSDAPTEDADAASDTDAAADVAWLDLGDVAVDAGCADFVASTPSTEAVALWGRRGAVTPAVTVPVELVGTVCGRIRVLTSAEWIDATWDGAALHIALGEGDDVGLLEGQVVLVHEGSPAILATIDVVARVFPEPRAGAAPHALFVGVDGMRADGMLHAATPVFDGLRSVGAWTLEGRTHGGTTDSSVGWTTLYTGVGPELHGVIDNGSQALRDWTYPTFAWRARNEHDLSVGMVAHWVPAAVNLHEDDAFDSVLLGDDAYVSSATAGWLRDGAFDLVLTHFDDVDHAGHGSGFSPAVPAYVEAIEHVDAWTGAMVDAILTRPSLADEQWLIVVATDHGGEGLSHGAQNLPNQRIPFIFAGSATPLGELGGAPVTQMDVFPTVLAHFGVEGSPDWRIQGVARADAADVVDADAAPPSVEDVCDDRVDQDGDAALDCDDSDCDAAGPCAPVCADTSLGTAVGAAVATGSNVDEDTDYSVTCARLPGAADVSFAWTSPAPGAWVFDTFGSEYDTILAVYQGECARPRDQLACNDDASGLQSQVTVDTVAGDTYAIVVSGFDGRTGAYVLNIAPAE